MPRFGSLWQHSNFKRLWAAQAVSAFGSRITRTALPIVAILLVTADPLSIAALTSLEVLPGVLVGLFAGGWVDRSSKRWILIGADISRALLVLSIPAAAWIAHLTMARLYIVAAIVGAFSALFRLADNAYLPVLIDRGKVVEGNSKLEATEAVAEIGGPGAAGILIQLIGAPFALLFDGLSYIWSAVFLARIDAVERSNIPETEHASIADDIRIGMRASFGHELVGPTCWAYAISQLFIGFFLALYMLFTIVTLGISPAAIGIIIGLGGVSALGGALLASHLSRSIGLGPAMISTLAAGKLAAFFIPLSEFFPGLRLGLLSAHQLIGDGLFVAFAILTTSLRQAVLPQTVLARANGMLQAMSGVLLPTGALIGGALASLTSVSLAVWIGVSGGLLAVLPLLRPILLELRGLPDYHFDSGARMPK